MTDEEITKMFEEDMPNLWSNFTPSQKITMIQCFSWGFEEGMNEMEYLVKIGGTIDENEYWT